MESNKENIATKYEKHTNTRKRIRKKFVIRREIHDSTSHNVKSSG